MYRVIHKSLRDFRTLQYNNQDRHSHLLDSLTGIECAGRNTWIILQVSEHLRTLSMFNMCFGVAYTAPVVAFTLPLARGIRLLIRFFTFILAKKHLQGLSSFGIPLLNHTYLSVCTPTPLYTGVRTTHNNFMIFVELGMNGARHFVPEHVNYRPTCMATVETASTSEILEILLRVVRIREF
jgi:hypothetical protein